MPNCHPHTLAYHAFTDAEVDAIRTHLLTWYRANRRRLPWRGDAPPYGAAAKQQPPPTNTSTTLSRYFTALSPTTTPTTPTKRHKPTTQPQPNSPPPAPSPAPAPAAAPGPAVTAYGVWVSEVMLQQTRVETVIPHYTRWMTRFPSLSDLATAPADSVNSAWSGLGYYRRARLLHEAAQHVQAVLGGRLPESVSGLLGIRGIGPYTAGAIASIAFHLPVPLVDGNVSRVLSRLRALHTSPRHPTALKLHWQLARQLAAPLASTASPSSDAGDWSQALMELGAVVCMPRVAECGKCPVRRWCRAADEVAERRRPAGGDVWRAAGGWQRRVQVELEDEEYGAGQAGAVDEMREEEKSSEAEKRQVTRRAGISNQRAGPGGASSKRPTKTSQAIELDHTLCSICDPQSAPPTTVLEYPSKAEKKPPTDEHVSVCVVSRQRTPAGEAEWLLVQRPADGLLAGQWEFPSVVHPPSASASSPSAAERRRLLTEALSSLVPASLAALVSASQCQSVGELTHVFSHRRHLMHVQRCVLKEEKQADSEPVTGGASSDGRQWRWMSAGEMTATGLTSGQRKVWALSTGSQVKLTARTTTRTATRKRKESVAEEEEEAADGVEGGEDEVDDAEQCDGEADGEWEVWPAIEMPEGSVEEADGVIVID